MALLYVLQDHSPPNCLGSTVSHSAVKVKDSMDYILFMPLDLDWQRWLLGLIRKGVLCVSLQKGYMKNWMYLK